MHDFIRSLASTFSFPGLSPRATTLFNQAMSTGQFRWGQKAKLVAGACLSLALRESKRPDSLHDIAFLLDETQLRLTRTLSSIVHLLHIVTPSVDPISHLLTLRSHLSSVLQEPGNDPELPASLAAQLKPLPLQPVSDTAHSLTDLITRLTLPADGRPAPTACAVYMLSLESHARASLPNINRLASCLGSRCNVGSGAVMKRYEAIQDEIVKWAEQLPWLGKHEKRKGRAKVSKRLSVARALQDVIRWQEEIWRKRIEKNGRPTVVLDTDDQEPSQTGSESESSSSTSCPRSDTPVQGQRSPAPRSPKRRKKRHALGDTTQFLLQPLDAPLPDSFMHAHSRVPSNGGTPADLLAASTRPQVSLSSYLLAAPSIDFDARHLPTRLQLLSVARGGADEIADAELFDDGEWEAMCRTETEMESLKNVLDIGEVEKGVRGGEKRPKEKGKGTGHATSKGTRPQMSSKINSDALMRFMAGDEEDGDKDPIQVLGLECFEDEEDLYADDEDDEDKTDFDTPRAGRTAYRTYQDDSEVVVAEWRPLSPT